MYEVKKETLQNAYKPFDIVTNKRGSVGFIREVDVNDSQDNPKHQISYAVNWLVGKEYKCAWFSQDELIRHCNLFIKISQSACHQSGDNASNVESLFNSWAQGDR